MSDDLNYFSYFSEVEDTFTRLRGKHLMLSPLDWTLLESWKERGVPLHVALRSIEEVFKNHKSRARKDGINSLRYCQDEVEQQFAQYLQSQVGKNTSDSETTESKSRLVKESILAHLEGARAQLLTVDGIDGLKLVVLHVVEKIEALRLGISIATERVDTRMLEVALTELENILDTAVRQSATPDQLSTALDETHDLLAPYKDRMDPKVYEQQIDSLLKKHLRELFDVPRLSLFHMK